MIMTQPACNSKEFGPSWRDCRDCAAVLQTAMLGLTVRRAIRRLVFAAAVVASASRAGRSQRSIAPFAT